MAAYINPIPSVDSPVLAQTHDATYDLNDYTAKDFVYFAFIDVLGFKKAFDDNHLIRNDNCADKFKKVFTYYFDLMNSANFKIKPERPLSYAGQTSDSLYFYTERADILIDFLKIFSHFYVYAMTQDVFFRGGIAKGNLYCKEDYQFYGESVINAYLLESQISRNPIITIDENTYKVLVDIDPECKKLIKLQNERHYLGPFAYLEHGFTLNIDDPSTKIREIDQEKLQKTIEENKSKFEYDSNNYGKYVFLLTEFSAYKEGIRSKIGG